MKILKALLLVTLGFTFSACKSVKIENGEVPEQYLAMAKKLEGIYAGKISGVEGQLVIRFEGNKPKLEFINSAGADIFGNLESCGARIGNLTEVALKGNKDNPHVDAAIFKLFKGKCNRRSLGTELSLTFKHDHREIRASYLVDYRQERRCNWDPGVPPHVPPRQNCYYESIPVYHTGTFRR